MLIINQVDTEQQLSSLIEIAVRKVIGEGPNILPQSTADQLLTIQEAAELLHLSVPTCYGLVHRKEIPVCKKGKRLYFPKQELIEWIKTGRKQTATELSDEAINGFKNTKKRN